MENLDLTKATLIKTDGTIEQLTPKGKTFTYTEIRTYIGNIIQPIHLKYWTHHKEYSKMNIICDEEGMIRYRSKNAKASKLLEEILGPSAQDLYGPVILLPNKLFRL